MNGSIIEYGIILLYFILILVKGLRHSKEIDGDDDFLLAGRQVGWFMLLCTMGATVVGGGFSIGAIGETYRLGLAMVLISIGGYLQVIFSGLFVAPKFRAARIYTVAGYFGHRFDEPSRGVSFILSLLFSVGVLGAQMVAFGKIIAEMTPLPYVWGTIIGAAIVILYSSAGGLIAVIKTDFYQFLILIAGFIITVILCIPELSAAGASINDMVPAEFFTADGGEGWLAIVSLFLAFLLGETFAPGYATRFCVGKDLKQTKRGIAGAGIFLVFFFPIVIFIIALYAKISFPDIDSEMALPRTILKLNNPVIGGIIIAALMSAIMSSADSILNSASAIVTKDLWEHYLAREKPGPNESLRIARYSSIGLGIAGILLALVIPNVIDLLLLTYNLWAPGIIVPVIVGVFSSLHNDRDDRTIVLTMILSIAGTVAFMLTPYSDTVQPSVFGTIFSLLVYGTIRGISGLAQDRGDVGETEGVSG